MTSQILSVYACTFSIMHATYESYCQKNQRGVSKDPLSFWMPDLVLNGILRTSRSMVVESGEHCLAAILWSWSGVTVRGRPGRRSRPSLVQVVITRLVFRVSRLSPTPTPPPDIRVDTSTPVVIGCFFWYSFLFQALFYLGVLCNILRDLAAGRT